MSQKSPQNWETKFSESFNNETYSSAVSKEYAAVVEGFVHFTNKNFEDVSFRISPSNRPDHILVMYRPKYIPRAAKMLCVLKQEEDGALTCLTVDAESADELKVFKVQNEDELFNYFSALAARDFLHADINIMSELNQQPVFEGYIHTKEIYLVDPEDIKIEVARKDVIGLSELKKSSRVLDLAKIRLADSPTLEFDVAVKETSYYESSAYSETNKQKYLFLEVNGYICKIQDIKKSANSLTVKVSKLAEMSY